MLSMGSTQASARVVGLAWLAELDFASGLLRLSTAPCNLSLGGNTYIGLGSFVGVSSLSEGPDSAAEQLTLSLALTDTGMLALVMGSVEGYRGRAARLYLQLFDEAFVPVALPVLRWQGAMNRVQVTRKPAEPGGSGPGGGSIELLCSRSGMARARHAQGLRLSDTQQQARYPGDTGLRYVRALVEKPVQWLSKSFQQI